MSDLLIIFLLFIAGSIWASFALRQTKAEIDDVERKCKEWNDAFEELKRTDKRVAAICAELDTPENKAKRQAECKASRIYI